MVMMWPYPCFWKWKVTKPAMGRRGGWTLAWLRAGTSAGGASSASGSDGSAVSGADAAFGFGGGPLGNHGIGAALLDEAGEFGTAIGDAGIKAETIQLEQRLEVALLVVAQGEHGAVWVMRPEPMLADGSRRRAERIVSGLRSGKRALRSPHGEVRFAAGTRQKTPLRPRALGAGQAAARERR